MDWISLISDIIGISSAIFAFFAWQESRRTNARAELEENRQDRKIKVILHSDSREFELPFALRRMEFNRAEVCGRIGMIPMKENKQGRYKIKFLNDPEFLREVNRISDSRGNETLVIKCTEDEINQFDISGKNSWFSRFGL